ncbi:hypothetical protein [Candidatus Tisiphia endosymbiont of Oplodontha viridula]|uniref:hypothetical protein n=1 Tax=Candidatus Tisiphia endosymbiont of Oplodontha viridula TaxID=3077925 RepID=UPI0035C8A2D2
MLNNVKVTLYHDLDLRMKCLELAIQSHCSCDAVDVATNYYNFLTGQNDNIPFALALTNKMNFN